MTTLFGDELQAPFLCRAPDVRHCRSEVTDTNSVIAGEAAPIPYSMIQFISSSDSSAVIAEKAAKVLPRPNQTAWMRLEGALTMRPI
jgi:hypothetical protein